MSHEAALPPNLLQQALAALNAGQWAQAEQCCLEVLRRVPEQPDALHIMGLIALQVGRADLAVPWLARAVAGAPQPSALLHLRLGVALQGTGKLVEALASYEQALTLQPDLADAFNNRGRALRSLGRLDEAAGSYRQALALQPGLALTWFSLGLVQQDQSQIEDAMASYRQALLLQPALVEAHFNLGHLCRQQGQLDAATACYRQAAALQPQLAQAHFNLGLVLQEQGHFAEATGCYRTGLALQPDNADNADSWNNLGVLLHRQGRLEEAEIVYRRALALQATLVNAETNLGDLLLQRVRYHEAEACYRRALAMRPDDTIILCSLGTALLEQDRCAEAANYLQAALAQDPDFYAAHGQLGWVRVRQGLIDEGIACYYRALALAPEKIDLRTALFMPLQYSRQHTQEQVFAEAQRYAQWVEGSLPAAAAHDNDRNHQRRLKIGYISPDFRDHAVAYFIEPVLEQHDRARVEVFCYYNFARDDAVTARLRALVEHWRPCRRLGDEELAALIRADGIDILVDLSGHTAHNRLPVFAQRPAPVQVSWLGYLGSTGLAAMDYRLTDDILDPPGATEAFHTETLVRLPAWAVFRPDTASPPVNDLPARSIGHITFASLNNLAKINADVVGLWARILLALPDARLILGNARDTEARERLLREFAAAGITAERLEIMPGLPLPDFLALHHRIDLALDPFPFTGGATTGHALWMGVPVVTLAGDTTASRQGSALLQALDLPELVATDADDYVKRVLALAADLPRLQTLRVTLRERMAPEQRAKELTRNLERVYSDIWGKWCKNK